MTNFMRENDIEALYLNCSRGWRSSDYSFLEDLPFLKELSIISSRAEGLNSVEALLGLEELDITTSTEDTVDFARLTALSKCFLHWWDGAAGILDCLSLQRLHLDGIPEAVSGRLRRLRALRHLNLANSSVLSLDFLGSLPDITKLELMNCRRIGEFAQIAQCRKLSWLAIDGNKHLRNLAFVGNLKSLEVLSLSDDGDVPSLTPLSCLVHLKALAFDGSTNIVDGNLVCLTLLPELSMLMFKARRHYSHELVKPWDWGNFGRPDVLLREKRGGGGTRRRAGSPRP